MRNICYANASMPTARPRRSRFLALAAVREHFRETGAPPSLSDLARRLGCSRQRVCALVADLEREGLIMRTAGEAFSIRLKASASNLSDADLAHELTDRLHGTDPHVANAIGAALREAYAVKRLTTLELPDDAAIAHLMLQLSSGGDDGEGDGGTEANRAA